MAYVISIANQKGGIGKTTMTINLADALQRFGRKVLVVDMNPQVHATKTYGAKIEGENTIVDVMKKDCSAKEAIQHMPMGDILPGDSLLNQEKMYFNSLTTREKILKKAIRSVDGDYDYIMIDTPPELDIYLINSLTASDGCVIPVDATQEYSIQGLDEFMKTVKEIKEDLNEDLKVYGILISRYDNYSDQLEFVKNLPEFAAQYGIPAFESSIKKNQFIEKVKKLKDIENEDGTVEVVNRSLFENYGYSRGAKEYAAAARELIQKVEGV